MDGLWVLALLLVVLGVLSVSVGTAWGERVFHIGGIGKAPVRLMFAEFPVFPNGKDVFIQHLPEEHKEFVSWLSILPRLHRNNTGGTKPVIGCLQGGERHFSRMIVRTLERETFGKVYEAVTYPAICDSGGCLSSVEARDVIDSVKPCGVRGNYQLNNHPRAFGDNYSLSVQQSSFSSFASLLRLIGDDHEGQEESPNSDSFRPAKDSVTYRRVPTWRVPLGLFSIALGLYFVSRSDCRATTICGWGCGIVGVLFLLTGYEDRDQKNQTETRQVFQHYGEKVAQDRCVPVGRL
jgi:hypothetical protein